MLVRKTRKIVNIWFVSIVIVVCILLLMLNSGIKILENTAGFIVLPFQRAGNAIINGVGSAFDSVFNSYAIKKENSQLKSEIDSLKAQLQIYSETAKENERLTELFGYLEEYPEYETILASVTAFSPDNWSMIIVVNKGSQHGVAPDMPVVAQGGLVGRVIEVSDNWSKIMTVIDSRSKIAAIVERSRDTGIVEGVVETGNFLGRCRMINMPFKPSIMPGDTILTSEAGGVFPKGLVIGRVSEVSQNRTGGDDFAIIVPSVDFAHLEDVLILKEK
ncbi:MAG TPA: rod shape-determining protein MreC [Clostridia bacterium]|nr:rod shape-determining protein MreC [Clostridia bacterium]